MPIYLGFPLTRGVVSTCSNTPGPRKSRRTRAVLCYAAGPGSIGVEDQNNLVSPGVTVDRLGRGANTFCSARFKVCCSAPSRDLDHLVKSTGWTRTGAVPSGSKQRPRRITGWPERLLPPRPRPATFTSSSSPPQPPPPLLRGKGALLPRTPHRDPTLDRRFSRGWRAAAPVTGRRTPGATLTSATTTPNTARPWIVEAIDSSGRPK